MRRGNRRSSDDSDSLRTSSSDEELAKLKAKNRTSTLYRSKVKATIPLNHGATFKEGNAGELQSDTQANVAA